MKVGHLNLISLCKRTYFATLLLLLTSCSSHEPDSSIQEINSIQDVATIFSSATSDDLFVFDVDSVIFETKSPIFPARLRNNSELIALNKSFDAFVSQKPDKEEWVTQFWNQCMTREPVRPVEPMLIDQIHALQKRGIKVMALTAVVPGHDGKTGYSEVLRDNQLLGFGIDFRSAFGAQIMVLDELQKTEMASRYKSCNGKAPRSALFYNGVLLSVRCFPKGIVLRTFLEKIHWRPARIFFFDDSPGNVNSVVHEMKNMGIPCHGFVYKAAAMLDWCCFKEPDLRVARSCLELIMKRNEYVTYAEAREALMRRTGPTSIRTRGSYEEKQKLAA